MTANGNMPEQRPPPSLRGGRTVVSAVLTEDQRRFAAEHHGLVYSFLRQEGLPEDEYYDIAVFGYLRAILRYDADQKLRRYEFSTIAWLNMRQSIAAYHRAEARRQRSERRYLDATTPQRAEPFEEAEYNILLHELASAAKSRQYRMAELRLRGYSVAEIARSEGMTQYSVRKLLRDLFQTYLRLNQE